MSRHNRSRRSERQSLTWSVSGSERDAEPFFTGGTLADACRALIADETVPPTVTPEGSPQTYHLERGDHVTSTVVNIRDHVYVFPAIEPNPLALHCEIIKTCRSIGAVVENEDGQPSVMAE